MLDYFKSDIQSYSNENIQAGLWVKILTQKVCGMLQCGRIRLNPKTKYIPNSDIIHINKTADTLNQMIYNKHQIQRKIIDLSYELSTCIDRQRAQSYHHQHKRVCTEQEQGKNQKARELVQRVSLQRRGIEKRRKLIKQRLQILQAQKQEKTRMRYQQQKQQKFIKRRNQIQGRIKDILQRNKVRKRHVTQLQKGYRNRIGISQQQIRLYQKMERVYLKKKQKELSQRDNKIHQNKRHIDWVDIKQHQERYSNKTKQHFQIRSPVVSSNSEEKLKKNMYLAPTPQVDQKKALQLKIKKHKLENPKLYILQNQKGKSDQTIFQTYYNFQVQQDYSRKQLGNIYLKSSKQVMKKKQKGQSLPYLKNKQYKDYMPQIKKKVQGVVRLKALKYIDKNPKIQISSISKLDNLIKQLQCIGEQPTQLQLKSLKAKLELIEKQFDK